MLNLAPHFPAWLLVMLAAFLIVTDNGHYQNQRCSTSAADPLADPDASLGPTPSPIPCPGPGSGPGPVPGPVPVPGPGPGPGPDLDIACGHHPQFLRPAGPHTFTVHDVFSEAVAEKNEQLGRETSRPKRLSARVVFQRPGLLNISHESRGGGCDGRSDCDINRQHCYWTLNIKRDAGALTTQSE